MAEIMANQMKIDFFSIIQNNKDKKKIIHVKEKIVIK